MKNVPFNACDGATPYVFISYAHSDSADVYPLIRALHESGFPVWYDGGIEAGDDWANKVAASLAKAKLCLLFATPQSVTRDNVLREVVFAEEHGIPVTVIRLGLSELPDSFSAHLRGAESFHIGECRTYRDFVARTEPGLAAAGVKAEGSGDRGSAPDILKKRIRPAGKSRRTGTIFLVSGILLGLALTALLLAKLLFAEVPVVVGEEAEGGTRRIEASGFTVSVGVDYSDEYPYGVVFSQDREGLTLKFFPVVLTKSLGPERELITVPGIVGDLISEGAGKLVAVGMKRFTVFPELDDEHEKSEITYQSIPEGLRVSKENVMELNVATDGGTIEAEIEGKLLTITGTDPVEVDFDLLPDVIPDLPEPVPEDTVDETSVLGRLGLGGRKLTEITELYVYGNTLRETPTGAYYNRRRGQDTMWIPEDGQFLISEAFEGMSELGALKGLTSLSLVGAALKDLSAISSLAELTYLDVSGNRGIDLTELRNFPKLTVLNIAWTDAYQVALLSNFPELKTVYADSSMREGFNAASDLHFEVIYLDAYVTTREELLEALTGENVHNIYIAPDSNLVLREEYDLTVREDVFVTGTPSRIMNAGKLTVCGTWELGLADFENVGTVIVKAGGSYAGGMGCTMNYGTFLVEKGGFHSLERGQGFKQYQGLYENDGVAVLYNGGNLNWTGGRIVNRGTFMLDASFRGAAYATELDIDFSEVEGEPVTECSAEELEKYLLKYGKEKD